MEGRLTQLVRWIGRRRGYTYTALIRTWEGTVIMLCEVRRIYRTKVDGNAWLVFVHGKGTYRIPEREVRSLEERVRAKPKTIDPDREAEGM